MSGLDLWPAALDQVLLRCTILRHAVVLHETRSTQTLARERASEMGLVVTAGRQTHGRGRLGREWFDTLDEGIALSAVVPDGPSERLAMASAVATSSTAEAFLSRPPRAVGIKWPNDVVVDGRKLAGVLIERVDGSAIIGIGLNVRQTSFPDPLARTATSLAILGAEVDRLPVLVRLVEELDRWLGGDPEALLHEYGRRDALRGTRATFATANGPVTGEVLTVDPFIGLVVRTAEGDRHLAAATTTVTGWGGC